MVQTVSVIVPAFNEELLLEESLGQIKVGLTAFSRRGWNTELIVCDNNSADRTAEIAQAAGARVVFEPVNQIALARNSGAASATGDWLIFIDADSRPSMELFEDVADQIEGGRCLAGGCTIKLEGHYPKANLVAAFWNGISRVGKFVAGSFIFCEAAAFRETGGFSRDLFAGEEIELIPRLKRLARGKGKRIVILHRHPMLTSARKMRLYTLREHFRFLAKVVVSRRKVLRSRADCHTWYDGRR
jgi:glycosyltransferase involved in cell wall biosynthesis